MAQDCVELSPRAREIFEKIVPYFPRDSYGNHQFSKEGKIFEDNWYDLRLATERQAFISRKKYFVGNVVSLQAEAYRKDHGGSLNGFTRQSYSRMTQHTLEILLLIEDLDFQIETGDFVNS